MVIAQIGFAQALQDANCNPSVAGVTVAKPALAQVVPTPPPPAPPTPAPAVEQIARAAPRAGDADLQLTPPLLSTGAGTLATGLWLLLRMLARLRRA